MLKQLKNSPRFPLSNTLLNELNKNKFVFNSSLVIHNGFVYVAFRVYDDKSKAILAFIYVLEGDRIINCINLSEYFLKNENVIKVADPKMFIMNDKVHCTFNTGDAIKDVNSIFLLDIENNSIGNYFICNYVERMRTEKNWAFFNHKGKLLALYSLNPLTLLEATEIKEKQIRFKAYFTDKTQNFINYSIGTPLVEIDGNYGFIAHKKYFRKRKRLYIGKPCTLNMNAKPALKVNKRILIHSLKSLLGEQHKFNKNLISCSYFSGIQIHDNDLVISYGINDIDWNIATIKTINIWP
ncbi:hypothetical protein [Psychroserpens mesophilus]|uniref:hypothetical protein n=1 Tax=Psychroserpens mesophilus TaxID=325473 RepID=UPI00058EE539|nr:hypothetical protein [Psychroserpens mesophilus]